jgi:hypothetical protein
MTQNPHADQLTFRAWLIKQLTLTRWSLPSTLTDAEAAARLGVRTDVLREANALRAAELKRRGHGGIARGKRRYTGSDYAVLDLRAPGPIHKIWLETCAVLGLAQSTIFRSLVHHFLLAPARPAHTAKTWVIRGRIYRLKAQHDVPSLKTRVPKGLQIALDAHAEIFRVPLSGLLRGIVTEFLEGRTQRLKIVTYEELWGDPDRYLHPEKFA